MEQYMGKTLISFWNRNKSEGISSKWSIIGSGPWHCSFQLFCKGFCFLCRPVVWTAPQVLDLEVWKWCGRENYCRSGRKELDLCCVVAPDRPSLVRQSTRAQCSNLAELSNSWSASNHWENRPGRRHGKAWNFRIKIRNNTNLVFSFTQKKSSD